MDGFAKCDQPRIVPFAALAFNAASFAQSMDRSARIAAGVCTALVRAMRRISIALLQPHMPVAVADLVRLMRLRSTARLETRRETAEATAERLLGEFGDEVGAHSGAGKQCAARRSRRV